MSRYKKAQLLSMLIAMDKVNNNVVIAQDEQEILTDLIECQQMAIHMGNYLEAQGGTGGEIVTILEDYCETVYQQSIALHDENKLEEFVKTIQGQLNYLSEFVQHELPDDKKEIVFFPYKASMWDSMESIWQAAEDDLDCNAYVVPIPYYDKKPDGTLGEFHYEGNGFPETVPIIDWREYDVEDRHPDVIVIHNPYDSKNQVTSIHSDYYSSRLKQYTDKLVYVPYFVTPGVLSVEFCLTEGFVNADKVIVQSESVRRNYIEAICSAINADKGSRNYQYIEGKIIALGSPKLEKASKCVRKDYNLPHEWRAVIEKPDGMGKKVFFYNIGLSAFLSGNEQYIQKLRSVLDIFRQREDIVLWLRPHPLIETTLEAMRPELLTEYRQLMEEYRNGSWGIYDDTSDLYRAVAWSDVYYGDRSSVTMLFSAQQKPVMIQAVQECGEAFENILWANGYYWFTSISGNGLFRINAGMDEAEFMGCFPGERKSYRLYQDIAQYKNILVFTPFTADAIAVYRMDTEEVIRIPLKEPHTKKQKVPYNENGKFSGCTVYGKYAFLFPCSYPAIIKLDLDTYEAQYLYEPIAGLEKMIRYENSFYFKPGIQNDDIVKLWCVAAGALVEFDMEREVFKVCYRSDGDDRYIRLVENETAYWVIPCTQNAKVLKLSKEYQLLETIALPDGAASGSLPFVDAVATQDDVWIFPGTAGSIVKISSGDSRAELARIFDVEDADTYQRADTDWRFFFGKQIGRYLFAFHNFSQELYIYDLDTGSLRKKKIRTDPEADISKKVFLDVLAQQYQGAQEEGDLYIYESSRMPFHTFIDIVQKSENELKSLINPALEKLRKHTGTPDNDGIGRAIYKYISDNA